VTPLRVCLAASFALAGCADAGTLDEGFELSADSLGIVHAHNRGSGLWTEDEAWRIGAPSLRIGSLDGDEPMVFGHIADVAVGPDDRVYILDFQAKDIRVFGPDGEFLFRFGRPGEGPGEFSWPDAIQFTPDGALAVRDVRLFRITLFSPDGVYLRDFRIQRPYPQMLGGENFWITQDGTFVDRLSITLAIASSDSLALTRYASDGAARDTLILAETRSAIVSVLRNGMTMAGVPVPFSPRPVVAVAPDGRIARTLGTDYRIEVLDPAGGVERVITRSVEPVAVSATERDSALEAMRASASELVSGGVLDEFVFPATKPAITHLIADASGRWWVGSQRVAYRFAPPTPHPESFDVFDGDGRFLGTVATPFRILEVGVDYVAGVSDDSLGVSYAVVAPLTKRAGPDGTR
jgi:hypothetical protein